MGRTYRDLEVWQRAMDFAVECYEATSPFPRAEMFGLTSQIRRAATSIPANIAEGQGRQTTREFLNFLSIARGSLKELETHLMLSVRVGLLSDETLTTLLQESEAIGRMLFNLRRSLGNRL